jgi:roadblock/LC7 domain-containing protein
MTPQQIESAAEALLEGAIAAEEFAHDGDWVPEEYRAQVWKRAAEKVASFAEYMGRKA